MNKIEILHDNFVEVVLNDIADVAYLPIDKGHLISKFIRKQYSADEVEAIIVNGSDTDAHAQELQTFQNYRQSIKTALTELWSDIETLNNEWLESQKVEEDE